MASIGFSGDTSGLISVTAPLVAGSGVLTLPTGTDTLIGKATTDTLTNKSIAATQLTGTIPAARLAAGSVLQVVNVVKLTSFSTTSTSYVDITGLTASITPSSTNSKILVLVTLARGGSNVGAINLLRGATNLLQPTTVQGYSSSSTNYSASDGIAPAPIICLDSPSSVSAVTYTCQIKTNTGTIYIGNRSAADMEMVSTITLMEIAG
jgi:hypothetical protein